MDIKGRDVKQHLVAHECMVSAVGWFNCIRRSANGYMRGASPNVCLSAEVNIAFVDECVECVNVLGVGIEVAPTIISGRAGMVLISCMPIARRSLVLLAASVHKCPFVKP